MSRTLDGGIPSSVLQHVLVVARIFRRRSFGQARVPGFGILENEMVLLSLHAAPRVSQTVQFYDEVGNLTSFTGEIINLGSTMCIVTVLEKPYLYLDGGRRAIGAWLMYVNR